MITEKSPSPALIATKSLKAIDQPKESDSFLVPSLFPNVPSYLSFSSNLVKGPDVPHEVFKVLKFRVTSVMPKVVRIILTNSGMRLLKSEFSLLLLIINVINSKILIYRDKRLDWCLGQTFKEPLLQDHSSISEN